MRHATRVCLLAFFLFLPRVGTAVALEQPPRSFDPDRQLEALNDMVDELKKPGHDTTDLERTTRGERINQAFVVLTGEAINPLFGITVLGMYNYFASEESLRPQLPLHDRPEVWVPLLAIVLLMFFNSTICEAVPFLKVPLNALGDIVNKVGAVAILPLVVKIFADAVAAPVAEQFAAAASLAFPVAHAGEATLAGTAWLTAGWLVGALGGAVIYLVVWMTFNMVDVLILICPFPGIDAILKTIRIGFIALLAGTYQLSPLVATVIGVAIVLISFLLAGWSFRLSVFGLVFSTDIIFRRDGEVAKSGMTAFVTDGMNRHLGTPMRTLGRVEITPEGMLAFSYRPWLILARRRVTLGDPGDFSCGVGLINPIIMFDKAQSMPWLRLPPRYCGHCEELTETFGLRRLMDCGITGSLRTWLKSQFGNRSATS